MSYRPIIISSITSFFVRYILHRDISNVFWIDISALFTEVQ